VPMTVVADRFVEMPGGRIIDLSTGSDVLLMTSSAGGPADQLRWATRCDWFQQLFQPSLARLLDYGLIGDSRRFEAWQCCGSQSGTRSKEAGRTTYSAAAFLRACGLTAPEDGEAMGVGTVPTGRGGAMRLVAIPGDGDGYPCEAPVLLDGGFPLDNSGIVCVERRAVAAAAELFEVYGAVPLQPQVLCLWGPGSSGKTTALLELARIARRNGFVPISARLIGTPLGSACSGRAVFLIDDDGTSWRRGLLEAVIGSPHAHVVVFTASEDAPGTAGASLGRLDAATLAAAVRPAHLAFDGRVRRAAEHADGLPGRFARHLLNSGYHVDGRRAWTALTAAERAPSYGVGEIEPSAPVSAVTPASWPDREELVRLRDRAVAGATLLAAGRHASGDRELRRAMAGLARRGDWAAASDAALALAASMLRRGRPREAKAVLDASRTSCHRASDDGPSTALATLAGVAWTDLGRLDEAERVLSAAAAAVPPGEGAAARIALALARCRFWRGRFHEADSALEGLPGAGFDPPTVVRLHSLRARIAVGRLDFSRAMSAAAEGVRTAETAGNVALIADARWAAGFAHLAVDDVASLRRDADACIAAAAAARDPLRAFRARLLLTEQLRRAGQRPEAQAVLRVLNRFAVTRLPPILRRHYDMVVETMTSPEAAQVVAARHATASGLAALTLFAPRAGSGLVLSGVVEDAVAMLGECQGASEEDEEAALGRVCEHAQRRLEAAAVAFFGIDGRLPVRLAGHGSKLDAVVAERASVAGIPISPHRTDDRIECAVPIRCGGLVVGALAARWTIGRFPDSSRAVSVLTMAATAAAPLVQSRLAARVRAAVPASHGLLGVSAAMNDIRRAAERAAAAPFAVLIEGESGSGKELVARAVHRGGARRDRPFRTLNCAALPDDLVESELFGHARGAFTGAVAERVGVFEEAHTGTLLLDEVGELSPRAQAKLLRVIQEGELRRIGENLSRRIDVRIVAATNRDLRAETAAGRFRLDLLYRLDVVRIAVPPLRERREDIPLLVEHFWREATDRVSSRATLGPATVSVLARYDWPGNIRELQNVLAALAVRSGRRGVVGPAALPPHFLSVASGATCRLDAARRAFDERFVRAALVRTGGLRAQAAVELGISRQGLGKLMLRLGIPTGT